MTLEKGDIVSIHWRDPKVELGKITSWASNEGCFVGVQILRNGKLDWQEISIKIIKKATKKEEEKFKQMRVENEI